ncbi:hypothetical protein M758_1G135100 [Ceratodon purpureus]|uniref:Uncharacterized protein n=1 Tax=Ceratodon purpureus TaxID=3225 RepID=A0A8T0J7M9_CERPU|nr:hypothetical protein KC19_1G140200 [Ceratodon purpureus]KAG0629864.1 hypothetical protein M758_1G135100 [Ceratodon purpureus]
MYCTLASFLCLVFVARCRLRFMEAIVNLVGRQSNFGITSLLEADMVPSKNNTCLILCA